MLDGYNGKPTKNQCRWLICRDCIRQKSSDLLRHELPELLGNAPWHNPRRSYDNNLCEDCAYALEHYVLDGSLEEAWEQYYIEMEKLCARCQGPRRMTRLYVLGRQRKMKRMESLKRCDGCPFTVEYDALCDRFFDILPRPTNGDVAKTGGHPMMLVQGDPNDDNDNRTT